MRRLPFPATTHRWLAPLLVVSLLLVSATLALAAPARQLTWGLGVLLGVGFVLFSLCSPSLGLAVAAVAGLLVPYYGPSGLNITIVLVAVLLGVWLLDMLVRKQSIQLVRSRTVPPLLAFLTIAVLSFMVGQLHWFNFAEHAPVGAQFGGLSIVVLSAGVFLLAANQVPDARALSRITWVFLVYGALYVVVRMVLPAFGLHTRDLFQPMGSVFFIWLVAMAFSQAVLNRDLRPAVRLALGALVLVMLYFLIVPKYGDKSGWLPALVAIAAIIGVRSWRAGWVVAAVAAVTGGFLLRQVVASEGYSVSTRVEAWSIVAQIVQVSPIWGLGFANYYWYAPLFRIAGYAVSFNSHNNYMDILAQTGLVGLGCYVWFLAEVGGLALRLRQQVPDGFARAYVYGAIGGLVGTVVAGMLGDWVLPFFYNIGLTGFRSSMLAWLFLGGLVSLERACRAGTLE